MAEKKLFTSELLRRVDAGDSYADIAKDHGISRQAVHKRVKELRGKTTKAVVVKKIDQVVDQKLDAVSQLQKINEDANELLDLCMRWQRGDDEALQILESQIRRIRVGKTDRYVDEFKIKDPRELALKAMAEIRNQLKLQLEIYQTLYDMKAVAEFQDAVLTAISEVDPDVRDRIIQALNKKRVIRSAVKFS